MTSSQEFYASNVDEAVAKAARNLNVPPADLTFEVVDEGSEGFLGIGARDARIRVQVPDSEVPATSTPASAPTASETSAAADEPEEDLPAGPEEPTEESSDIFETTLPHEPAGTADEERPAEPASEETLERVREVSASFVSAMGLSARVDVYDTEEYIAVDLVSDHTALLIGQKGETLDALQHLVNCSVYKGQPFTKRITLDSEGYRQRRIEAIQGMAHRAARKAVREDREFRLPPMQSTERRIVHLYLQNDEKVTTYSEGTGSERRVTIAPV